ncbi:Crp/Fnr family transcriptional regulator [Bacillus kwashiorkori]|uniref:Crp/Fnr family transcriptional regulator n=1 Tax=Bacillus kwashiorkori TaxID=1522318 RepID=UPI0007821A94|nr:Crp/Fnr family transcriptional regulator [Bacillus kwashiorkori]
MVCKHHSCQVNDYCISAVPIFNHLEDEQMAEIMDTVSSASFKKGEIIYRADEEADSLYIVNRGKVKIYRLSESGKELLVRILDPGDFTGELALFKKETHEAYAEAMIDTEICIIRRSDIEKFLLKYPSISLQILSEFANRLEQTEKQTTRFATETVETRLALFLADLVENGNNLEFVLPMAKKDLASYLGTTPETLSRKLLYLEELGLIKQKPKKVIEIIDLDGLLLV